MSHLVSSADSPILSGPSAASTESEGSKTLRTTGDPDNDLVHPFDEIRWRSIGTPPPLIFNQQGRSEKVRNSEDLRRMPGMWESSLGRW